MNNLVLLLQSVDNKIKKKKKEKKKKNWVQIERKGRMSKSVYVRVT